MVLLVQEELLDADDLPNDLRLLIDLVGEGLQLLSLRVVILCVVVLLRRHGRVLLLLLLLVVVVIVVAVVAGGGAAEAIRIGSEAEAAKFNRRAPRAAFG